MKKLLVIFLSCLLIFSCNNDPDDAPIAFKTVINVTSPEPVTPKIDSTVTKFADSDSALVSVTKTEYKDVIDTIYYRYKRPETTMKQYKIAVNSPAPQNQPPTARAGEDITITLPVNSVSLNGSQSSDPEGGVLTYQWSNNNTVFSTSVTATLTNLLEGTFSYTLKVTDDKGAFSTDVITVTVKPAVVVPPPTGTPQPISVTQLTGDFSRPEGGAEVWYRAFQVPINGVTASDRYIRFSWAGMNPADGQYNWSLLDKEYQTAIDNKQGLSFGIMTQYLGGSGAEGVVRFENGASAYPQWLHNQMKTEAVKPLLSGGDWVPVYNSNFYLNAFEKFTKAMYDHINTTSHKGVLFKHATNSIDIRGYGDFGEWHNWPYGPDAPSKPTTTTLKKIVDIHKNGIPDIRLAAMISGVSTVDVHSATNAEVAYYLLTQSNQAGEFGIRRDNWGATEVWYNDNIYATNTARYNNVLIRDLINNKWTKAPITGEPCCNSGYAALPGQVTKYHVNSFGNGNYGSVSNNNIVNASRLAGPRLSIASGTVTPGTGILSVTLNWSISGAASIYKDWNVIYELKSGNTVVKSAQSTFNPKLFLPASNGSAVTKAVTDNIGSIQAGTYTLTVKVVDPFGYRSHYPLANQGRASDGSYTLKTNIVIQ